MWLTAAGVACTGLSQSILRHGVGRDSQALTAKELLTDDLRVHEVKGSLHWGWMWEELGVVKSEHGPNKLNEILKELTNKYYIKISQRVILLNTRLSICRCSPPTDLQICVLRANICWQKQRQSDILCFLYSWQHISPLDSAAVFQETESKEEHDNLDKRTQLTIPKQ